MKLLLAALLFGSSSLFADSVQLKNGVCIAFDRIIESGQDELVVSRSTNGGTMKIPYLSMTLESLRKFGCVQKSIDSYIKTEMVKYSERFDKDLKDHEIDAMSLKIRVVQVLDDGLLCRFEKILLHPTKKYPECMLIDDDRMAYLQNGPTNVIDADELNVVAYHSGTHRYQAVTGANKTIEQWTFICYTRDLPENHLWKPVMD
jgi:hypothetical protein